MSAHQQESRLDSEDYGDGDGDDMKADDVFKAMVAELKAERAASEQIFNTMVTMLDAGRTDARAERAVFQAQVQAQYQAQYQVLVAILVSIGIAVLIGGVYHVCL